MTDIPIDREPEAPQPGTTAEIEREITKRRMIDAITSVVMVVLYMVFAMIRDRDPGVVPLGAADDWDDGNS